MVDLTYLHNVINKTLANGVINTYEELIKEGPKGLVIKLYNKVGDKVEKLVLAGKGDSYTLKSNLNGTKEEKTLTKREMLDELSKNKKLKFASDFLKTQKGGALLKRIAHSMSRTKPKKTSKKDSKKSSKKASKKISRKSSKKTSKKSSKNTSKSPAKKTSRKSSRRRKSKK